MQISSYTKIYNLGDLRLAKLCDNPLVVEEKVDGSQFSFMLDEAGQLHFRSKKVEVHDGVAGMFQAGVDAVKERVESLIPGYIYRGEYLSKPKHNTLMYSRIPKGHIVIWDIQPAIGLQQEFLSPSNRAFFASEAGFETVPVLFRGNIGGPEQIEALMETVSFLGGSQVEGIVLKNYHQFNDDGKLLAGKYVSERFKEINNKDFRDRNPKNGDIIQNLIGKYRCEARWEKAVQHLRDSGDLTHTPADIGPLMKEISQDLKEEEQAAIKEELFKWAWKNIGRGATKGFPEWYKEKLMKEGFGDQ